MAKATSFPAISLTGLFGGASAERSLFSAELAYTQTQGTLFQVLIGLYKAMGGGLK